MDKDNHLVNPDDYGDMWIRYMIKQGEIGFFSDEHQRIVNCLRLYYKQNNRLPLIGQFGVITGTNLTKIYELFSNGMFSLCRVAGLPRLPMI